MNRTPLWIGEVAIVRAIFGHAARVDPDRCRRITPTPLSGRVAELSLEAKLGRRRLDVLVEVADESGARQYLVVEAKVGAIIDPNTLLDYLGKVRNDYGPAQGLLVTAYEPVGDLPSGWDYRDLGEVAAQLSCRTSVGALDCGVCEEIGYAVDVSTTSGKVQEWRALAHATRDIDLPTGWVLDGEGSSVGRPLVKFQSPWLDDSTQDSYVQIDVGNNFGTLTAMVMVVSASPPTVKAPYPDDLWRVLAASCTRMPPLPEGIVDSRVKGRGAAGDAGSDAKRNSVPPNWSVGFSQPGWHARGRALRHMADDCSALLPAALDQGLALFEVAHRTR